MIQLESRKQQEMLFDVHVQAVADHYTAFCIICHAQVFGDDVDEVVEDITEHLNEAHPRA